MEWFIKICDKVQQLRENGLKQNIDRQNGCDK